MKYFYLKNKYLCTKEIFSHKNCINSISINKFVPKQNIRKQRGKKFPKTNIF